MEAGAWVLIFFMLPADGSGGPVLGWVDGPKTRAECETLAAKLPQLVDPQVPFDWHCHQVKNGAPLPKPAPLKGGVWL